MHTKAQSVREALEAEVCALFERVVAAPGTDLTVEQVAAAAMEAVEGAVKDEVEAATVVKATAAALERTLAELQAITIPVPEPPVLFKRESSIDSALEGPPTPLTVDNGITDAPAALMPDLAAASALALAAEADALADDSTDFYPDGPSSSSNGRPESASPAPAPAAQQQQPAAKRLPDWVFVVAASVAAVAVCYSLLQSPAGQDAALVLQRGWEWVAGQISSLTGNIHLGESEAALLETIWLLLTSIICVPLVVKLIPGGNPVLGYLIGGAIVGPYALGIIQNVTHVKHLAELGVVFLLFNIGLELSLDRLQSMAKYVFGMGTAQVVLTLLGVAAFATTLAGLSGPSAIILGGALAMSTTAVAIQVLEDRGEMGSRHGRATFSVLLLQDLAVVVLLMLIPLLAPGQNGSSGGMSKIAAALGAAAVKAAVCIVGIIAGGRVIMRPLYKKISSLANAEIFAATTLLVVLGTSLLTQLAGLSLALGAFLAGLLLAETEYALQVESDIAPYKGLLMGLFFMSVGMEISVGLFIQQWRTIILSLVALIAGKLAVMAAIGPLFGLSRLASTRAGLLLAPGGEFAFVAFGEAVARGVLPVALTNQLYLTVALSMALTPYLAALGGKMGTLFERNDMKALQPQENEVNELRDHVIIAGYGRVGQIIGQMLSEELIPFVAIDVRSDRVQDGRALDLPVYFGDAGSAAVLHSVGAERAACAVITLDTPGANYRSVWAMHKHFPHVKTYVRAHDINHGINLEKAGATVVVPEVLEPSMQLAAAILSEMEYPTDEVTSILDSFRKKHLQELQALCAQSGTSLGVTLGSGIKPASEIAKELIAATKGADGADDGKGGLPSLTVAIA